MLLSVILQDPASATAQDDLRMIEKFVRFLGRLADDGFDVQRLLTACIKLHDVAACAISISQAQQRSQSTGHASSQSHTLAQLDVSSVETASHDHVKIKLTNSLLSSQFVQSSLA